MSDFLKNAVVDNFDEKNIEDLGKTEVLDKAFTMVEGQSGATKVKPAIWAMKKSADLLMS